MPGGCRLGVKEGKEQAGVEKLQTTPRKIVECYNVGAYGCYVWELKTVHYKSPDRDIIPLTISFIDSIDGDYIDRVNYYHSIIIAPDITTLSFDLSLVFKNVVEFVVPGPGFVRTIRSGLVYEMLFSLGCSMYNAELTPHGWLKCLYFDSPRDPYTFYGDALVSTGFYGYLWLVEYEYVRYDYRGRHVLDASLTVYLVPQEVDGKLSPAIVIDEDPYNGFDLLEHVYRLLAGPANTTWERVPSLLDYYSHYISVFSSILYRENGPIRTLTFIAIPVGALIVAVTGDSPEGWPLTSVTTLSTGFSEFRVRSEIHFFLTSHVITLRYSYIELTPFLIKKDGKHYRTPLIVIWPHTTPMGTPSRQPPEFY